MGSLKKAIKLENEHRFADVDAYELTVYKVLIPDDDGLATALENLRLDDHGAVTKLRATDELSDLFPNGHTKKHLEIIVQFPGACYAASDPFHILYIYYQILMNGQTL